jgi:uncharacterized membrane protein YjjP (DUF1212 family)
LATLGYGFLESGQTTGQTENALRETAGRLGIHNLEVNTAGRVLFLASGLSNGSTVSVTGAARSLDMIDCTRSRRLSMLAEQTAPHTNVPSSEQRRILGGARDAAQVLRNTVTPWWIVTLGMTMLAFFISMQVGVTWRAWVSAALVQLVSSGVGFALTAVKPPKLFAVVAQSSAAGAFATLLVQLGFVDPVGAAAAIAVNWLLLLPLPQVIGAITEAIEGVYLSALTRLATVGVVAFGISLGGAFTFGLGELLGMDHPKLDELPNFPWYLVLVFSSLGAIANAFANGGRFRLVGPAAFLGVTTGAVSQMLLNLAHLPSVWASSCAGIVLGTISVIIAKRTGYPQQVLALMGITGALLPGIPVFFGILQEMGGASGLASFGQAAITCLGIGVGVAFGVYLGELRRRIRAND